MIKRANAKITQLACVHLMGIVRVVTDHPSWLRNMTNLKCYKQKRSDHSHTHTIPVINVQNINMQIPSFLILYTILSVHHELKIRFKYDHHFHCYIHGTMY